MKITLTYLATQLSEAEIEKIVAPIIKEDGAVPRKDMGKDESVAMKQQKGPAHHKLVQETI